jgi:ABC-type spermidine/putrescine transport system permease subunit II
MEAARLLGARCRGAAQVALPLARPAVAAGTALALMETLADYGVSSYFGIQTFTAGIYKAWLSMDNRIAAAQLATMLLALVVLLLWLEQPRAAAHALCHRQRGRAGSTEARPVRLHGRPLALAWLLCAAAGAAGLCAAGGCSCCARWRPTGRCCPGTALCSGPGTACAWAHHRRAGGAWRWLLAFACAASPTLTRAWCSWRAGLRRAGRGDRGGPAAAGGLAAGAAPQWGLGALVTATAGHGVGLSGALLRGGAAVGAKRLCAHPRQPGRFRPHAGRGGLGLLARVHWPLLRRSTAAAALLVFVDVMKELPATMVLRPFNTDTLAVVAYQLARDERLGEAALPSLALVLVGLVPVVLLSRTLRAASGVAHEEHAVRVGPEPRRMAAQPGHGGEHVARAFGPCRLRRQPVADAGGHIAVRGELRGDIGMDVRTEVALAAHEGAAMHEHEQGRALCPLGHEHVHDLARMRPIGDRLAGLTASHTGCPQQRLVQAQHGVARLQDVAGPARAPVPQACVDGRVDCRVLCPRALSHRGQCSLRRRRTSTRS